ncbi:Beta-barrel assembly-enhancing protease [Alphaproteobacteria bacterium SO-S41]|nr:Beta-barrel assembly-enhancing protease [Alphaproteobacteria bacterium SO-S41]
MRVFSGSRLRRLLALGLVAGLAACGSTTTFRPRVTDDQTRSGGTLYGDFLVATYAGNTRDSRVAAARYLAALERDPTNQALLERAFIFSVAAGDMDAASKLAPLVAKANPVSDLAPLVQGVIALKDKSYPAAKAFFTDSHPPGEPDLMAGLALAWTAVGSGDVAAARSLLKPTGQPASDVFISYHRARLEEVLNNPAGADAAYQSADEATAGKSLTVALAFSSWLQATSRGDVAEKVLKKFLDSSPGNPVAVSALARLRAGKPISHRITTPQQGAAEGFYGIASAVSDGDVQDAAIVYLRLAQFLDPENDGALAFLGGAMERAKRTDEAIELYREVPASSPFYVTAQVSAADLLDERGDTEEAIKILTRLEEDEATSGLAASALGDVYRTRERWDDAVDAYGRAIARSGPDFVPDDWPLFYARGIALERAGRWAEAEKDLRFALKLSPDQPQVLNYLAYGWIERHQNVEEALAMLQRAVEQRPDDGFIIDSLGWAYYRLGQYAKAVETLELAINFSPYEPTVNEHLGDAYWKTGRQREAQFLWNHALTLKPDKVREPIIRAKIAGGLPAGEALERQAATEPARAP